MSIIACDVRNPGLAADGRRYRWHMVVTQDDAAAAERRLRFKRALAVGAAVAGAVTEVGYLRLIGEQGTGSSARVTFFATFVGVMTFLAVIGAVAMFRRPPVAAAALVASAAGFLASGFLGLMSIGMVLILAGGFAVMAIREAGLPAWTLGAAIVGPIVALAIGLVLT